MFDGMMPDMPEDRPTAQVSKSAEQVADAVGGTEKVAEAIAILTHRHFTKHFLGEGLWPATDDYLRNSVHVQVLTEEIGNLLRVSSQTASAASPVAGVSELSKGMDAIAFLASVVRSGEPWTDTCKQMADDGIAALKLLAQRSQE